MPNPAISLIIVSHKRPRDLERALTSLSYQSVQNFEIIVVADHAPVVHDQLKIPVRYIAFSDANISRARNLGLCEAAAPLVAFCDDDAVPDPFWLERLVAPFYEDENIAATGGFVRGRNGISYQWKAVGFLRNGADVAIDMDENLAWQVFEPSPDHYIKTVGTNCAFRKSAIFKIGGYDEGFHYYLDDTDLNMRLQDAGYSTAIVPGAQVIHNYTSSRGRKDNRVPQSLYNLGASTNLFLRKHCPQSLDENLAKFHDDQDVRLDNHIYFGLMTPRQKKRLMRDLDNGLVSGAVRKSLTPLKAKRVADLRPLETVKHALAVFDHRPEPQEQSENYPVYVRIFYTHHAARLGFHRAGYWILRGGRFGRIHRQGRFWRYRTPAQYRRDAQAALQPYFVEV